MMIFRHSTKEDIPEILAIIEDAKALLKSLQIDQWQNGYPNQEQIENDIKNKESYVVVKDNTIIGTTMFTLQKEPTYEVIHNGSWIVSKEKPYGVIHRLATSAKYRKMGIAQFIFENCHKILKTNGVTSLKIDTHEENMGMQSLIKKLGYQYTGIIYTNYNAKRLAFEKVIG